MPNERPHLEQASRNEEVAGSLADAGYFDWAVTALAYAGLHLIDAYLARSGVHPRTHEERYEIAARVRDVRPVSQHLFLLQRSSREARYDCRRFSAAEFQALDQRRFQPLKRHLHRLLGLS